MARHGLWIHLTGIVIAAALTAPAGAAPPTVVKASPDDRQKDVDPATREIRITFDQPMDRRGHSVVGGGPTFPKLLGRPSWADDRTFVLRVRLQPDHDYWLSINSDRFTNFRNKAGEPATPYPISFSTAKATGEGAAEDPAAGTLEQNRAAIDELRRAVDEDYSYRDRLPLDWDKLFRDARPKLEAAPSPRQFAQEAARLLAHAKDLHVWLKVGDEIVGTHFRRVTPNINARLLPKLVPGLKQHGRTVLTGRFDDGIVYVAIGTWARNEPAAMDAAFKALAEAVESKAKAVIIDVRPNSGGDELLAREVAGCFVAEAKVYSKNTNRRGGEDHGPYDRVIEPSAERPHFRGKVAVLMGRANMSSCDSFLLMMRQAPQCTLVGETSYGSSGNPKPHDLGNGVTVYLSSWNDLLPDGTPMEGVGVKPDVEVKTTPADFQQRDPVLEAALRLVR